MTVSHLQRDAIDAVNKLASALGKRRKDFVAEETLLKSFIIGEARKISRRATSFTARHMVTSETRTFKTYAEVGAFIDMTPGSARVMFSTRGGEFMRQVNGQPWLLTRL